MPMPTDDAEPAESGSAQKRRRQRRKTRVMPEIILIRCICRYASVADNCLVNVDLLFGGSLAILIPMGWAAMMMKHFVYKVSLEWLLPFDSDDEGDPDAPAATLVAVDSVLGSRQQFADLIRAAGDSADESEPGSSKYDDDDDDDDDADDGPDDDATMAARDREAARASRARTTLRQTRQTQTMSSPRRLTRTTLRCRTVILSEKEGAVCFSLKGELKASM